MNINLKVVEVVSKETPYWETPEALGVRSQESGVTVREARRVSKGPAPILKSRPTWTLKLMPVNDEAGVQIAGELLVTSIVKLPHAVGDLCVLEV